MTKPHFDRGRATLVEHGFNGLSPVLPDAALGHLDMAASGQWLDFHKQRGDAVAHVIRSR